MWIRMIESLGTGVMNERPSTMKSSPGLLSHDSLFWMWHFKTPQPRPIQRSMWNFFSVSSKAKFCSIEIICVCNANGSKLLCEEGSPWLAWTASSWFVIGHLFRWSTKQKWHTTAQALPSVLFPASNCLRQMFSAALLSASKEGHVIVPVFCHLVGAPSRRRWWEAWLWVRELSWTVWWPKYSLRCLEGRE